MPADVSNTGLPGSLSDLREWTGRHFHLISFVICFLTGLLSCFLQNFSRLSLESVWTFDSGHYLSSCQQIVEAVRHLSHGAGGQVLASCRRLAEPLLVDGPVLPCLGAVICLLFNQASAVADCRVQLVLQAVLHAVSAVFVCALAEKLSGNKRAALLAGLVWAAYPASVIAAGKFLSETLVTVILLGATLAACSIASGQAGGKPIKAPALLAGFLTGCLMLSKPALCLAAGIINLLALLHPAFWRNRLAAGACLLLGISLLLAPWAACTKLATGHAVFMNQRMATLNVVTGLDHETDGWGCLLEAPLAAMFPHNDDALATAIGIFQMSPARSVNLALRKITRLWAYQWNDFRFKFLGIPVLLQQWWHHVLLFFGTIGLLCFLSGIHPENCRDRKDGKYYPGNFAAAACAIIIAGHLTYIMVVANPRYGFTAMPFIVVFAGYAVATAGGAWRKLNKLLILFVLANVMVALLQMNLLPILASAGSDNIEQLRLIEGLIKAVGASAVLAAVHTILARRPDVPAGSGSKLAFSSAALGLSAIIAAFATTSATTQEWSCPLVSGEVASRDVFVPARKTALVSASQKVLDSVRSNLANTVRHGPVPAWAMVIFDGDAAGRQAVVSVNGRRLKGKAQSLLYYTGNGNDIGGMQIYGSLLRLPPDALRQWRAVPVPLSILHIPGTNRLSLQAAPASTMTVYGSYAALFEKHMKIPSLGQQSATRLLADPGNLDFRPIDLKTVDVSHSKSCFLHPGGSSSVDLSRAPGRQFGQYRIFLLLGYAKAGAAIMPANEVIEPAATVLNKQLPAAACVPPAQARRYSIALPELTSSRISISINGRMRSRRGPTLVASAVRICGSRDTDSYFLPGTPARQLVNTAWQDLSIQGEFPCSSLPHGKVSVELSILSNQSPIELVDLNIKIAPVAAPDFHKQTIAIF